MSLEDAPKELTVSSLLGKANSTKDKCVPADGEHRWETWYPHYLVCRLCMSIDDQGTFISAPDVVGLWGMRVLAGLGSLVASELRVEHKA